MPHFSAKIKIIGINPYVSLPKEVLAALFRQAARGKGPIPVNGTLNGRAFRQTLVKYGGAWRLYLNAQMRKDAKAGVGDAVKIQIAYDPVPRTVPMLPALARTLARSTRAKKAFESLPPSRRKEILRYLHSLKSRESVDRTIRKAMAHLTGRPAPKSVLFPNKIAD